jgi:hypothetical protein
MMPLESGPTESLQPECSQPVSPQDACDTSPVSCQPDPAECLCAAVCVQEPATASPDFPGSSATSAGTAPTVMTPTRVPVSAARKLPESGVGPVLRVIHARAMARRRQLAAAIVLFATAAVWFSTDESNPDAGPPAAAGFRDVEQLLSEFEQPAKAPLREPAEPIDTQIEGDVAVADQSAEQHDSSSSTNVDPAFFSSSPFTAVSPGAAVTDQPAAGSAMRPAASSSVQDTSDVPLNPATAAPRQAKFKGLIQPLQ